MLIRAKARMVPQNHPTQRNSIGKQSGTPPGHLIRDSSEWHPRLHWVASRNNRCTRSSIIPLLFPDLDESKISGCSPKVILSFADCFSALMVKLYIKPNFKSRSEFLSSEFATWRRAGSQNHSTCFRQFRTQFLHSFFLVFPDQCGLPFANQKDASWSENGRIALEQNNHQEESCTVCFEWLWSKQVLVPVWSAVPQGTSSRAYSIFCRRVCLASWNSTFYLFKADASVCWTTQSKNSSFHFYSSETDHPMFNITEHQASTSGVTHQEMSRVFCIRRQPRQRFHSAPLSAG